MKQSAADIKQQTSVITPADLREISFFNALDDQTLADIARYMQPYAYRAGDYIVFEGEQPPGLFFVRRGRVRLARTAADGREQVLTMIGSGENFNAIPLFDDQPNPTTARAMSAVYCLLLPRSALIDLVRRHPDLALAALRELAGQLRDLVVLVDDLAFRSVRERLARQLLREASAGLAALTHQELAERAGTVREIAGRVLRQFAQEGIVRLERGRVVLLDRAKLTAILEG